MTLPANCGVCVYLRINHCHRNAPAPQEAQRSPPTHWPIVELHSRCGQGSTTEEMVFCRQCMYWVRSAEGAQSGICTFVAPVPSRYQPRLPQQWSMTDASDCCGDGVEAN